MTHRVRSLLALLPLLLWLSAVQAQSPAATSARTQLNPQPPAAGLVLTGELDGADHQTYRELAFEVPEGVTRLRVTFDYDRSQGTVIDLGVRDPLRLRGFSGGNKAGFEIAEFYATASYLPGPLIAGTWQLILGIPNHRPGVMTAFRAEVVFDRVTGRALSNAPRWYRGDFHAHSGHSDGSCLSLSDARTPCPVYRTAEAAVAQGLDFVSLTEHNTVSHRQALAELQGVFDRLLLIAGMELTTFKGHANLFGPISYVDFRTSAQDMNRSAALVRDSGGVFSINHPGLPSDERCMGCGWTASIDPGLIDAVEIVNGGALRAGGGLVDSSLSGIPFWESLLNAGHRVTAIGGSDNHDPLLAAGEASAIGRPTTVVYSASLSEAAILQGVRSGRVFVDVEGTKDRMIDLMAATGSAETKMGDWIQAATGTEVKVRVLVRHVSGTSLLVIRNGATTVVPLGSVDTEEVEILHEFVSDGKPGWIRAEVRDGDDRHLLISNPIYLNPNR